MKICLLIVMILSTSFVAADPMRKKPLCKMCEGFVENVDEVVKKEGDIAESVEKFCRNDVPRFLVEACEKMILKNLKYIIERLKMLSCRSQIVTLIIDVTEKDQAVLTGSVDSLPPYLKFLRGRSVERAKGPRKLCLLIDSCFAEEQD
ncbi:unnamed protein product [Strongylus vulgaris]|uniref:Saposin B-type domain-containing protein n=1 Tax=Strongylus vulgaris TaxID=40348 RepID=A0A3P7J0H4_STRVU|nr:unnamed protein product [Strongylus vulgaris]